MITIDGSSGEGGGQVLRYACALSLLTQTPFKITNIRGGRKKPGLMRQHVTSIEAAASVSGSKAEGVTVGASEITFKPGAVMPGTYHFAVGTAGSTALVLQTILMPLLVADAPSKLVLEGGTHAMAAPPFEFLARSLLPIINRMGPTVSARLIRHGFYPRGGGQIEISIEPAKSLAPIECLDRGEAGPCSARAVLAGIPFDIAERELKATRKILTEWPEDAFGTEQLPADNGPGNALLLVAEFEHVTEVTSGFARLGLSAEKLAKTAAKRMSGYLTGDAFAGPYLQDQLLLPMAMARHGAMSTVKISNHTRTAVDLIARFMDARFRICERGGAVNTISL